jgi:hypothetical protein
MDRPGRAERGGEGWTEWFSLGRYALDMFDHRLAVIYREWRRLERYSE